MANRYGPLELPGAAWRTPDVRAALRTRDVSALLRLVQQYTGASQARMATALGMGQGRVNEIVNGKREISRLDVFERLAEGLCMPDQARLLLGLAPAHAAASGDLAGHGEISQIYSRQEYANAELQQHAATVTEIRVLAVRALGLLALNDSLLHGPLTRRGTDVSVQVLLLSPDSPAAATRAAEIGESTESFTAGIHLALSRLDDVAGHAHIDLETRVYDGLPTWRMLSFDGTLYLGSFGPYAEGHRSSVYKLTAAADGVLHAGFRRYFDDQWRQAAPRKERSRQ